MDRQERIEKTVIDLKGEWPKGNGGGDCLFLREGKYTVGYVDYPWGDFICHKVEFMETWERKFRKVEQAVIDFDGKWPSEHTDGYVLQSYLSQNVWCVILRTASEDYICTYPEFMETRKRLENKPTEWPEDSDWRMQDCRGFWSFSEGEKPESCAQTWHIDRGCVASDCRGHVFGDWRNTLERRPEPKAKQEAEPEGVEWLPPVGEECLMTHPGISNHGFAKVRIMAYFIDNGDWRAVIKTDSKLWREDYPVIHVDDSLIFRPIQSHRDKVIEAAIIEYSSHIGGTIGSCFGRLYDKGQLKLPEEQE